MSGGIARGRLAEERKAWRKNHPHVRTTLSLSSMGIHSFCLYLYFNIVAFLLINFILFIGFCNLGFCCEARDSTRWYG